MRTQSPNHVSAEEGRRRREALVEFLLAFSEREMVAPTRREIGEHLGIGENAVTKHIGILLAEGAIEDLGGTRGLRASQSMR